MSGEGAGLIAAAVVNALLEQPASSRGLDLPALLARADPADHDVLAYLARRHGNAGAVAASNPRFAEWARDRQRQIEVMADDFAAGLHHDAAQVEEFLGTSWEA